MRFSYRSGITIGATVAGTLVALSALAVAYRRPSPQEENTISSVFRPFAPAVRTRSDGTSFYVESNGMPDHPMMVGIMAWQQQVPLPQPYTGSNAWQFPVKPAPAAQPLSASDHFLRGAIAIAADGVPIFNALNNRGEDAYLAGELDAYGGHAGRADDYHYHVAPLFLEKIVGRGKPIAYALDGYPIYGLSEPDGTVPVRLDAFNGHTTPALGYHYHATRTYPYINGGFHGVVTERAGQVDPQPRAQPVRPGTPPLPGARITVFSHPTADSYSLTYMLEGQPHTVNYRQETDGSYTFDYVAPSGDTETRRYSPPPDRPAERRPGGDRRPPQPQPDPEIVPPAPNDFQLTSPVVANGGALPAAFTCDGESASPPVAWKNPPAGTRSFALVMHHLPPAGEAPHVYWIVYNIPATVHSLPSNASAIGNRGANTVNDQPDYAPPCSQGPGKKWYTLTLYALSAKRVQPPVDNVDRASLLQAIRNKILGTATLQVSYTRPER